MNYSFQIIQIPHLTNFRDVRQITKKIQQNTSKELYTIKMVAKKRTRRYGNFGIRGPAHYIPNQQKGLHKKYTFIGNLGGTVS